VGEYDDEFVALYQRERVLLCRAVSATLGDAALGAEAVDEAFARAYARWSEVRSYRRPAAWIYRVAINWATSWHRKWSRRPTRPVEELDTPHEDVVADLDALAQLRRLTLDQRRTLVLRYVLDLSVDEVAAVLDVSPGTVKSRCHRALARITEATEVLG